MARIILSNLDLMMKILLRPLIRDTPEMKEMLMYRIIPTSEPLRMKLGAGPWSDSFFSRPIRYGILPGTGTITRLTGIPGVHSPGITIMGISITGTMIITDITAAGTTTAIQDGTTIIIPEDDPLHLMYITGLRLALTKQHIRIPIREGMGKQNSLKYILISTKDQQIAGQQQPEGQIPLLPKSQQRILHQDIIAEQSGDQLLL